MKLLIISKLFLYNGIEPTSSLIKVLGLQPKEKIIDDIKITPVEYADQVIKIALTKELKPTEWVEVDMSKKDDKSQASIQ